MSGFREVREMLLYAHASNMIDDTEFVLLYDVNSSKNPDLPYWNYPKFDLDNLTDQECLTDFRFYKNDVYNLKDVFQIPDEIVCYNRTVVDGLEALCIFLRRFAYPCRYGDLIPRFGRPVPELCIISNEIVNTIHNLYGHKLQNFNQAWLSPAKLEDYAHAVHQKGAPLDYCWGFVDGTIRAVCRPGENQRTLYNGHKRVHSIKFQSVVAPNGMIANLFGPVEGKRHDSAMLTESGLLPLLQQYSHDTNGRPLCIYGDPAYPLRIHLQAPFKGARLTQDQKDFNQAMSKVRVCVEWVFGDITNYFAFLDYKKNLKVGLSSVGKMYVTCGLLQNARTCLYKNTTSIFFYIDPPSLDDYLQ